MSSCVMTNLSRNRTGDGHVRQLYPTCIQSVSSYPYETSPLIPSLHYGTTERVSLYAPYTTLFLPLLQALFCSPTKRSPFRKGDTHFLHLRVQTRKAPIQERDIISLMNKGCWREP